MNLPENELEVMRRIYFEADQQILRCYLDMIKYTYDITDDDLIDIFKAEGLVEVGDNPVV